MRGSSQDGGVGTQSMEIFTPADIIINVTIIYHKYLSNKVINVITVKTICLLLIFVTGNID